MWNVVSSPLYTFKTKQQAQSNPKSKITSSSHSVKRLTRVITWDCAGIWTRVRSSLCLFRKHFCSSPRKEVPWSVEVLEKHRCVEDYIWDVQPQEVSECSTVNAHKGRQDFRQYSNRRTYSPFVGVIKPTAISVLLHTKHVSDISTVSGPKRKKTCTLRFFEDIHCIIIKLFTNSVLMFILSHFSQEWAALLEITLSELWNQ